MSLLLCRDFVDICLESVELSNRCVPFQIPRYRPLHVPFHAYRHKKASNSLLYDTHWSHVCQQIDDGSGMKKECTVEDLVKVVEELTRIH